MNKRLCLLALILSSLLAVSCAGPQRLSQLRIGVWAAERDLWDEAIYRWSRVLETRPNSAVAHNNLAVAYEKKGRFEDARREYELALKIAPTHAHIKSNFQRFKTAQDSKNDQPGKKTDVEENKNEKR